MYEAMRVWDSFLLDDLPPVQREFAEVWRETDKVVYSTTLDTVPNRAPASSGTSIRKWCGT